MDQAFDTQPLPAILVARGWRSPGRMKYQRGDLEILFDSSNAFQVWRAGQLIGDHFARDEEAFVGIVQKIENER